MRQTSSAPPAPSRSSMPPSMLVPLSEDITGRSWRVNLVCGRKQEIGSYGLMYFGVIDEKPMVGVTRSGNFIGEAHTDIGRKGHVDTGIEGKRITVEVSEADTRQAKAKITISDI